MKTTMVTHQKAEIQLSIQELEVFKNLLKEVQLALLEPEFESLAKYTMVDTVW